MMGKNKVLIIDNNNIEGAAFLERLL